MNLKLHNCLRIIKIGEHNEMSRFWLRALAPHKREAGGLVGLGSPSFSQDPGPHTQEESSLEMSVCVLPRTSQEAASHSPEVVPCVPFSLFLYNQNI